MKSTRALYRYPQASIRLQEEGSDSTLTGGEGIEKIESSPRHAMAQNQSSSPFLSTKKEIAELTTAITDADFRSAIIEDVEKVYKLLDGISYSLNLLKEKVSSRDGLISDTNLVEYRFNVCNNGHQLVTEPYQNASKIAGQVWTCV